MSSVCPSSAMATLSIYSKPLALASLQASLHHDKLFKDVGSFSSVSIRFNSIRPSISEKGTKGMEVNKKQRVGVVCYAAPLTTRNLQLICTISSAVLMLAKGTAVHKSFLVPLFALQAPTGIISWIRGKYGLWTAFFTLLVRLFFFIPGELELPFLALLLAIVAPPEVLNLRGRQEGTAISLAIAAYLAFQHFSRAGGLREAFDQGSIVATLAIGCILAVPCLLLI